ncbi:hypothetical protein [Auraticoccus monumenti]|uniref:Uncharacterized protein n=1 Tax=Auraticoccus monumenti TaxID=675864 RepID=A0A1G6UNZ2_9ACTN|nr:hypothetical protein [Auraticoccus monumenti]SDD43108.1 hypothetical protein SAMN04489747_0933 [Auraticoccus monumenti]
MSTVTRILAGGTVTALRPGVLDDYRAQLAAQRATELTPAPAALTDRQLRHQIGVNRARLAITRAKLDRLTGTHSTDDAAAVASLPLQTRVLTDTEIVEWEQLAIREADLAHRILLDERRLAETCGGAR